MKIFNLFLIIFLINVYNNCYSSEFDFTKIKGWTIIDSVKTYDSSDLWKYIDGAADMFFNYGFKNLHSCEMSSGNINVVIDIFDMGTSLNALGIYKIERGKISNILNIGTEAVITAPIQSLMNKNKYYIKLMVYEGNLLKEKNIDLLNSIADILSGTNEIPEEFYLLPIDNRIPASEKFTHKDYLGFSELDSCLSANYTVGEKTVKYFISLCEKNKDSANKWKIFMESWQLIKIKNLKVLYKKTSYNGLVGITKTKNGLFGIADVRDESELYSIFKLLFNQL